MSDEFDNIDNDGDDDTSAPSWTTGNTGSADYDAALDPTRRIRFLTTNGTFDAPVVDGQPMTLAAALTSTGRTYNNGSVFEMDGAVIALDTVLQPGATVIAVNTSKGG